MTWEHFRVGAVIDGKLRLERLIAAGGGGAVFEASHVGLRTRVAVKVLKAGPIGGERRLQRFLREARIAAKLKSEHAVRILDIATPKQGTPYLVMEYLQGETLGEMLARAGAVPIPDAVDYMLQAIQPLAEMHSAGIVHRDVKPANLFVARAEDGSTSLKLLDFGVATPDPSTEADLSLTITNAEIGTPLYMAPEQFTAAKYVDARVDVWSLGVTLYQLIAGRTPFTAYTIAGLRARILDEEPQRIEEVRPEIPPALADAVMRCLEKDPARRMADMVTLAKALAPFAGRPVPLMHVAPQLAMHAASAPPESAPGAITLDEQAATLDGSTEHTTPLPQVVSRHPTYATLEIPLRTRLVRVAMIPVVAMALLLLVAVARRSGAEEGPAPTQAIAVHEYAPKTDVYEVNDVMRVEAPVEAAPIEILPEDPPIRVIAPPRFIPRRARPQAHAVSHAVTRAPTPRAAAQAETVDDRIE